MSDQNIFNNRCCNPFEYKNHRKIEIRCVSENMIKKFPALKNLKICESCRKQLYKTEENFVFNIKTTPTNVQELVSEKSKDADSGSISKTANDDEFQFNNDINEVTDQSLINEDMAQNGDHNQQQSIQITAEQLALYNASLEVLNQMKEKILDPRTTSSEKVTILTMAPKSWGIRKTAEFFDISRRQVVNAKKLVETSGFFSTPEKKQGKVLDQNIVNAVDNFYNNDFYSKVLAGGSDVMTIKQKDGSRIKISRRLMYCNLRELHQLFVEAHPNFSISFSKFALLRPKHCVFAGARGTHSVCVCIHHENVRLMLDDIGITKTTEGSDYHLKDYHDCIKLVTCANPTSNCYVGECEKCPGIKHKNDFNYENNRFVDHLRTCLIKQDIDTVEFTCWTETDRSMMQLRKVDIDDFIVELNDRVIKLKTHDFICKQQIKYMDFCKNNLKQNEFLITMDFSENMQFLAQNAINGAHWNNLQCTLFTVVYYFLNDERNVDHGSIIIISDDLSHSTASVHEFQKTIINHLKTTFRIKKVIYFTDGAVQHFKNRFSIRNLQYHYADFKIYAEHHLFGTAHGKGPGDAVGGNFKVCAKRASLQAKNASEQILDVKALLQWAKKTMKKTEILYVSKESVENAAKNLKSRFNRAPAVDGIRDFHSFVRNSKNEFVARRYSFATKYKSLGN